MNNATFPAAGLDGLPCSCGGTLRVTYSTLPGDWLCRWPAMSAPVWFAYCPKCGEGVIPDAELAKIEAAYRALGAHRRAMSHLINAFRQPEAHVTVARAVLTSFPIIDRIVRAVTRAVRTRR